MSENEARVCPNERFISVAVRVKIQAALKAGRPYGVCNANPAKKYAKIIFHG